VNMHSHTHGNLLFVIEPWVGTWAQIRTQPQHTNWKPEHTHKLGN
jgi:hypothetical protein